MTDLVCVKCHNVKGASENLQPRAPHPLNPFAHLVRF